MFAAQKPPAGGQRPGMSLSFLVLEGASERILDKIARLAAAIAECPIGLASLDDVELTWFQAANDASLPHTPPDGPPNGLPGGGPQLAAGESLSMEDAGPDAHFAETAPVGDGSGIRFVLRLPLLGPDGVELGALCVMDRVPRVLSEEQHDLLVRLAGTAAALLELRRMAQQGWTNPTPDLGATLGLRVLRAA